jgi:hypothetical protein
MKLSQTGVKGREIGEWMSGATFIAKTPNVLAIFSSWDSKSSDG